MSRPRILIADEHALFLAGLRKLLDADYELVGLVQDGKSLVESAERLLPDVVLLGITLPVLNGIEAASRLHKTVPEARIVFLTMHADPAYVAEAFHVGASGYLLKRCPPAELHEAIATVLSGRSYVTPLIPEQEWNVRLLQRKPSPTGLSGRQREVLELLAKGYSAKQIAATLNISCKTVEFHKAGIFRKLGIRSAAELTKYAIGHGIVRT